MEPQRDHYEFLGLDPSASPEQIREATDRIAEQAARLVYSSPERSHELWERIRQIRYDLLLDDRQRAALDRSAKRSATSRLQDRPAAEIHPPPPRHAIAVPVSASHRRPWWPLPAAAVAAALAALLLLSLPHFTRSAKHPPASVAALSSRPAGITSGHVITLRWDRAAGATRYHVQVAIAGKGTTPSFLHPLRSTVTPTTHLALGVEGPRVYFWRVRAWIGAHWTRFSAVHQFAVGPPVIGTPEALAPPNGAAFASGTIRLCWSHVTGAISYELRIRRRRVKKLSIRSTCATASLQPGRYTWRVAAWGKGVGPVRGPFSRRSTMTFLARPARPAGSPRVRIARAKTPVLSGPVLVAARLPVRAGSRLPLRRGSSYVGARRRPAQTRGRTATDTGRCRACRVEKPSVRPARRGRATRRAGTPPLPPPAPALTAVRSAFAIPIARGTVYRSTRPPSVAIIVVQPVAPPASVPGVPHTSAQRAAAIVASLYTAAAVHFRPAALTFAPAPRAVMVRRGREEAAGSIRVKICRRRC